MGGGRIATFKIYEAQETEEKYDSPLNQPTVRAGGSVVAIRLGELFGFTNLHREVN